MPRTPRCRRPSRPVIPSPGARADLAGTATTLPARSALGVSTIDPVRITVGRHHALGLLALTTEEEPGVEHDLLTHAGFTTETGDFPHTLPGVYTLPGTPNDPTAIRRAVATVRTGARALGIRIGIDPDLATALEQDLASRSGRSIEHRPAAPVGPAPTTAAPARRETADAPHRHAIR